MLAAIDKRETPDLTDILVAYGLDPPHSAVRALSEGVLEHIASPTLDNNKKRQGGAAARYNSFSLGRRVPHGLCSGG